MAAPRKPRGQPRKSKAAPKLPPPDVTSPEQLRDVIGQTIGRLAAAPVMRGSAGQAIAQLARRWLVTHQHIAERDGVEMLDLDALSVEELAADAEKTIHALRAIDGGQSV